MSLHCWHPTLFPAPTRPCPLSLSLAPPAGFPQSEAIIARVCEETGLTLHTLDMSELAKADGALTCCSVLAVTGRQ